METSRPLGRSSRCSRAVAPPRFPCQGSRARSRPRAGACLAFFLRLENNAGRWRREWPSSSERVFEGGMAKAVAGVEEAARQNPLALEQERPAHLAEQEVHRGRKDDGGTAQHAAERARELRVRRGLLATFTGPDKLVLEHLGSETPRSCRRATPTTCAPRPTRPPAPARNAATILGSAPPAARARRRGAARRPGCRAGRRVPRRPPSRGCPRENRSRARSTLVDNFVGLSPYQPTAEAHSSTRGRWKPGESAREEARPGDPCAARIRSFRASVDRPPPGSRPRGG